MDMRLRLALALVSLCILSACAGTTLIRPSMEIQRPKPSIRQALPNAVYPIESASTGTARLKEGVFEEPVAPGSASKTRILLGKEQVFGDLNGDGTEDAVVTLMVDHGGSGIFTYLALVLNESGAAKPLPAVLLGDRIMVKSIRIDSGVIIATILSRKPDAPMSAKPEVEIKQTFKLHGDKLK
jgi:hypothetical protein